MAKRGHKTQHWALGSTCLLEWIVRTDLLFKRLENQNNSTNINTVVRTCNCFIVLAWNRRVLRKSVSAPAHPPADESIPTVPYRYYLTV
jgi:hypothetical protein